MTTLDIVQLIEKKADEIYYYYIKLEELLHETINKETEEIRNQLILKDVKINKLQKQNKILGNNVKRMYK
jgi:hypothetical protein